MKYTDTLLLTQCKQHLIVFALTREIQQNINFYVESFLGMNGLIGSTQKTRINAIFKRNRINSRGMFFLSMYIFII